MRRKKDDNDHRDNDDEECRKILTLHLDMVKMISLSTENASFKIWDPSRTWPPIFWAESITLLILVPIMRESNSDTEAWRGVARSGLNDLKPGASGFRSFPEEPDWASRRDTAASRRCRIEARGSCRSAIATEMEKEKEEGRKKHMNREREREREREIYFFSKTRFLFSKTKRFTSSLRPNFWPMMRQIGLPTKWDVVPNHRK